jgi:hypothetical protein
MANHVNSYISVDSEINEKAQAWWDKFCETWSSGQEDAQEQAIKMLYPDAKYEPMRGFYVDHVGAKWITYEDFGDDYISFTTAWCSPDTMFDEIALKLYSLDGDVKISMVYEDEMPNFVGYKAFYREEFDEGEFHDDDYDEIVEGFKDHETFVDEQPSDYTIEEKEDVAWDLYSEQMEQFWEAWPDKSGSCIQEFYESMEAV